VECKQSQKPHAAVNLYFSCQDGSVFKVQKKYAPYFMLATSPGSEHEVEAYVRRKHKEHVKDVELVDKEDLDLKNHLSGLKQTYLKISFYTQSGMYECRRELMPIVEKNKAKSNASMAYQALHEQDTINAHENGGNGAVQTDARGRRVVENSRKKSFTDYEDAMLDIREYDVPFHMRYMIDSEVRCGHWYDVKIEIGDGDVIITHRPDLKRRAEVRVCAFDIETTKLPLKFPDAEQDQVFMISYMLDGQGYLIINREVVSEDCDDFEYNPKPEYPGPFYVWNEPDEKALLRRWFNHMRDAQPNVYVTYNGDYFDFPFIETRAKKHGMSMYREIGFRGSDSGETRSKFALHLDAFYWVKRDSYLPAGSHGLKAVTRKLLKFNPIEVDAEDMLPFARSQPQTMAAYSVSDAVSTYYLYMKYVHPFIFSLATIIPLTPDEVLRKGSGTLCESLLMVEAYRGNIVCPNKQRGAGEQHFNGHPLESETYIGGHVECLQSGVFRSDIPVKFKLEPKGYQKLIDAVDDDLRYALKHEGKGATEFDVENYQEIREGIVKKLEELRDNPNCEVNPLIYHLDVAAMYPNIILTNRLQPMANVNEDICASCDFNRPGKTCLREMEWTWRGEHYAATSSDYAQIKAQLQIERFPPLIPGEPKRFWKDLSRQEQETAKKTRLKMYSQKVYRKVMEKPVVQTRKSSICMKENSFYIDTVRTFRDRRYEYKGLNKEWKGRLAAAKQEGNPLETKEAADMVTLYDSLQLAHKCILNSFYGYVMRKGARWYSMEMAGVVTLTGARIIQMAKQLVDDIGMPLELDTDGIWCCLPGTFPEEYTFEPKINGSGNLKKKLKISYPCVVLNRMTDLQTRNDQYQTLVDPEKQIYKQSSEMSIEFEVDGPYRAMILPASKEEGVLIKKRYAVFNHDGSLEELKGFELKRRGELKLIKVFQSELFEDSGSSPFLEGQTLEEVYKRVGTIANRLLDMLDTKGREIDDEQLVDYISESSVMSKSLEEYGDRKSTSTTTARRLGQFLGTDLVKDKGLVCKYIISAKPHGAPTSQRAIPVSIFSAEPAVARKYLRDWLKDAPPGEADKMPDLRDILDWEYYKGRLRGAVQKIISLPAALQNVQNPCPGVVHPDWLNKRIRERNDPYQQKKIDSMMGFRKQTKDEYLEQLNFSEDDEEDNRNEDNNEDDNDERDMEDFGAARNTPGKVGGSLLAKGAKGTPKCRVFQRQRDTGHGGPRTPPIGKMNLPAPDPNVDYASWLEHATKGWRIKRKEKRERKQQEDLEDQRREREGLPRQKRRHSANDDSFIGQMDLFLENVDESLATSPWQIVSIDDYSRGNASSSLEDGGAEGEPPAGVFRVWVVADGTMRSVLLSAPRKVYVATRYPDREGDKGLNGKKRVNVALPRAQNTNNFMSADGTSALNVYEVEFDASKKSAVQYGRDVAALLADPNVVGVYERDVPLEDWSIQTIGCVARVKREAANEILDDLKKAHKEGLKKKVQPMLEVCATNLDMKTTTEVNYLPSMMDFTNERAISSAGLLRHCSIYHAALDGKGVFAAHFPRRGGKGKSEGLLILLQPGGRAVREVDSYFVSEQFEDEKRRVDGNDEEEENEDRDSESCEWRVVYARTSSAAAKTLNDRLADFANTSNGPSVVLLEAPPVGYGISEFDDDDEAFASSGAGMNKNAKAAKRFEKVLTALKDSPILVVPFNSGDVEYLGEKGIAWQRDAAQLAAVRLAHTSKHLEKSIQISRYAHIPLCNLDSDWSTHVLDTFFARRLRDEQQVLWSGKNGKPDYGGGSMDDQLSSTLTLESMESPRCELSNSGAYRSVCCELRIHHLVVCAIVNSHILNDLEQGALLGFDGGNATVADRGGHDASNAFRTLRKMVAEMLRDASERGNEIADATLAQLRRWIFSSNSRMREPGMQHLVELCSRKVFTLLISELKRLGADVVFADTRRIIVSTKKNSLASASAFIAGLRSAIGTRELFNWLEIEPTKVWHTLLFRGPHDFGGLAANESVLQTLFLNNGVEDAPMDTENVPTDTQLDPTAVEGDEAALEMHWNIATFLPEVLSDHFKAIIGEFIVSPWKRERKLAADGANGRFGVAKEDKDETSRKLKDKVKAQLEADDMSDLELGEDDEEENDAAAANTTPDQTKKERKYLAEDANNQNLARNRQKIEEEKATWLCAQIDSYFTPRILTVARGFEKHTSRSARGASRLDERYLFPENLPGAHLPNHLRGNAALAFVKTVIAVLSLDDTIEDAVARCRKNALKLLSVPEFGPEATFYEPCVSFALRDVVCECCGDVRDLDLCRDPDLADGEWRCADAGCNNRYDLQWIEMKLCEEVNSRVRKAQTQDLKCKRCTRIKVGHVQNRCPCGGLFETASKPGALREGLRVFRNIAKWHDFDVLAAVCSFCERQT